MRSLLPKFPTLQKPVLTPIRTRNGCSMPLLRHLAFKLAMRCCISIAIRRHSRASSASPLVSGSPKKTSMASPTNLSTAPPCASAMPDISVKYSLSNWVICSGCRRSVVAGEILDVEKEDRQLLPLGMYGDFLLSTEDAFVDLRRQIARYLHRQRAEKFVGGLELSIHAVDDSCLAPLQQDEQGADAGDQQEIGQQIFESEHVITDRLRNRDFLDAADIADLPIKFRAFGMRVVAVDASLPHDHRRYQPDLIAEHCGRHLGKLLI